MRPGIFLSALILLATSSALSRAVEDWPYERLLREADVVVIGTVKSEADSDIPPQEPLAAMKAIARITSFDVRLAIKGDSGPSVDLLHFRLPEGAVTMDGPLLAHFRTKGPVVQPDGRSTADKAVAALSRPDYLLFLKRTAGGRLEPVSGQYDSELSVREIYRPLPAVLDRRHP